MDEKFIQQLVAGVIERLAAQGALDAAARRIPVGVSSRHIHLSAEHIAVLYGAGSELTKLKDLRQPGEFAAAETVALVGPKGILPGVRVLGPARKATQVELSRTDGFVLGIVPPVLDSGQTAGSAAITVAGPKGAVYLTEGVICAARHIHLSDSDAAVFGVADGDRVAVETPGVRAVVFRNVLVRVRADFRAEFHLDTDEANAAELANGDWVSLRRD